jgi:hypothetical protein
VTNLNWDAIFGAAPMQNADVAPCRLEQRSTNLCFQVPDLLAEGGLANSNLGCRPREMPSSATARKYRMWRSSIVISKTDHKSLYHILDQ